MEPIKEIYKVKKKNIKLLKSSELLKHTEKMC